MAIRNTPANHAQLVREGHLAAIRCVEAIEQLSASVFHEADLTPSVFLERIARLYHGLRNGWRPICRCWPQLRKPARDFLRSLYLGHTARPSPVFDLSAEPLPVTAWQMARHAFWLVVVNSPLHDSAIQAWLAWSKEYHPGIDGNCFDAHDAFLVTVPLRYWLKNCPPLPWMDLRRGIEATEAMRTQEECLPAIPGDGPGLPLAPKSLPESRTNRQRLVTRLDGLIDAADAGLRQHGNQFLTQLATFRSHIAAPMADEPPPFLCSSLAQVLPLWRELEEYLDPASLGATSWQVQSWIQELERPEYLKGRIWLATSGDWIATEELRHLQLGSVLNPFRRLRDQILTQLEEEAVRNNASQGRKGRGAKGVRGRKPRPEIQKRNELIREEYERTKQAGKFKGLKQFTEDLEKQYSTRLDITYDIVRKAITPPRH